MGSLFQEEERIWWRLWRNRDSGTRRNGAAIFNFRLLLTCGGGIPCNETSNFFPKEIKIWISMWTACIPLGLELFSPLLRVSSGPAFTNFLYPHSPSDVFLWSISQRDHLRHSFLCHPSFIHWRKTLAHGHHTHAVFWEVSYCRWFIQQPCPLFLGLVKYIHLPLP